MSKKIENMIDRTFFDSSNFIHIATKESNEKGSLFLNINLHIINPSNELVELINNLKEKINEEKVNIKYCRMDGHDNLNGEGSEDGVPMIAVQNLCELFIKSKIDEIMEKATDIHPNILFIFLWSGILHGFSQLHKIVAEESDIENII